MRRFAAAALAAGLVAVPGVAVASSGHAVAKSPVHVKCGKTKPKYKLVKSNCGKHKAKGKTK